MLRSRRSALARALTAAALVVPAALVLRGALLGGVLFRRDIHLVWHPQVEAFVRAIAAGSWPVWDPGPAFGQPLLADPSAMVLYPFTWLNLLMRPWTYYTVFAAAHLVFTAAGARLLARRLGASAPAALLAAVLWTASGPLLSLVDLWHHFAGAAWMPWVLLAAERALREGRPRAALLWGGAMGTQILAGSADMSAMTGLIALGLAASRAERRPLAGPHNLRLLGTAALAGAFALAVSAPLWMSALDVAARSDRAALPAFVRTYWSVHPLALLETLLPALWSGLPLRPDWSARLFEGREPFLGSLYLGLPAVALVAAALAHGRPRVRLLLLAVVVLGLLVALGRHAPFYDAIVTLLPPLRILRYPVKALVPVALAWSLLAGLGADAWRDGMARRRWLAAVAAPAAAVTLLAVGGALALGAFAGRIGPAVLAPDVPGADARLAAGATRLAIGSLAAAAALALAVARAARPRWARPAAIAVGVLAAGDLLLVHRSLQPVAPRELYTHRPEVVAALAATPHARVYAYDYTRADALARLARGTAWPLARAPEGWPAEASLALAMQMHLAPATAGRWGLRSAYDLDYRGLYPRDLAQLTQLLRALEGTPAHAFLLRLGGVSHVVSLHADSFTDLRRVGQWEGLYREPVRLFAVPEPLPRTYAVGAARVVDGRDALELFVHGDWSPGREVLLPSGAPIAAPYGFTGTSRVVAERPDRVRLEATLSAPGYVVLLDGFAPGWRARVDGEPVAVARANLAFRAVAVPAGTHTIELTYRPAALLVGLGLSVLALAGAAAAGLRRGAEAAVPA
jgi:hypothetical protein